MKRFALLFVVCVLAIIGHAQGHLCFMDIPLDSPLDSFSDKLVSTKGLVAATMTDGEQYSGMETKKLTGDFYDIKKCTFYVRRHERLNNVSSVVVEDTLSSISKGDANRIISLHDKKYGSHKKDSTKWSVWYTWKTESGEVEFCLHDKGFKAFYTDTTELAVRKVISEEYERARERQTVREICGIPFGSSYEKAAEVLENKYGTSSFLSDKTRIVYDNKDYAGISFDKIIFLFQSDGYRSYLNGCVFILEATSLSDAKDKRDRLYKKLSWKYDMKDGTDDAGIKYYFGGNSPVSSWDFGFSIDIIKYDNRSSIPYAARLMYGRYNYVKEEF